MYLDIAATTITNSGYADATRNFEAGLDEHIRVSVIE